MIEAWASIKSFVEKDGSSPPPENGGRNPTVDLKSELFTYAIDGHALTHARMMDGKLLLVINTTDLAPDDVVKRCKSLADIEN